MYPPYYCSLIISTHSFEQALLAIITSLMVMPFPIEPHYRTKGGNEVQ